MNVVHSLEPGETPRLGVAQGSKLCAVFLKMKNTLNWFGAFAVGCGYIFYLLMSSTVLMKRRVTRSHNLRIACDTRIVYSSVSIDFGKIRISV